MILLYTNIFMKFWLWLDNLLKGLKFDELFDKLGSLIKSLPELIKWGGAIFLAIIIVIGLITFIKSLFKFFIVLVVIGAIILIVTRS